MVHTLTSKIQKLRTNLNLRRVLGLVWHVARGLTIAALVMIVLESALFFASLYLLKLLVDAVSHQIAHPADGGHLIKLYVIAAAITAILYAVVKGISTYITELHAAKVGEYIDDRIHARAVELDLGFYESPAYFDILKRAKDAGPDKPNAIVLNLVEILKNAMTLVAIGSVLISIDWFLLPLLALFVLPTLLVRISFADKMHLWRMKQTPLERKSAYLSGLLTGDTSAKEIRGLGLGNYLRKLYVGIRMNLLTERMNLSRDSTKREIITTIFATLGFFVCVGYIALGTVHGHRSVGNITLFLVAFPQSFNTMQALSAGISKLYQNNIFVTSIFELFDLTGNLKEPENPVAVPADDKMDISINGLNFTYPHSEEATLTDINLQIPSGKIIAVIGLNGAGKTTLIKLLCRLYDPVSGNITMGGIDIRKFNSADYRKQISTVFQDFGKYNVTAAENIQFGNIDGVHNEEEMIDAAKNSGAHDFINKFPDGYETMMGRVFEDGHEVSIGQWQKLAIARSFYSPARFLILDEATSALDAVAEKELFESFRERIGNRAALIITHRLSAVKHADFIYVLSGGRVQQSGTHDELINLDGDYARLFKSKAVEAVR
jgi:ATP-binding cassette, subfamily B, bacterial